MINMIYKDIELWDILKQYKNTIFVDDSKTYKQVTISKTWIIKFRWEKVWSKIWRKRQFVIDLDNYPNTCLFIRQWVQNWWIWVAVKEVDNCIVTENMPMFSIENINIEYFKYLLRSKYFKDIVNELIPTWAAQKAIHEKVLLKQKLSIPKNIEDQKNLVEKIKIIEKEINLLENIWFENCNYVKLLKQSILQEAIEWKLTKSWRKENRNIEPASVLLEKIKDEKEELIKQKKLKKQKELEPILEENISFDVPESWEWCKLWEVTNFITDWKHWDCNNEQHSWYFFLSAKNIKFWKLFYEWSREITKKDFLEVHSRTNLEAWDICMVNTWATIWKLAIVEDNNLTKKTTFQKSVAVIKLSKELLESEYIANYLLTVTLNLLQLSWWTAINNLLLWQIRNFIIPIPPLEEQKEIVKKVDEMMKLCDELEKQTLETKENSENLMKAVLGEVFSK